MDNKCNHDFTTHSDKCIYVHSRCKNCGTPVPDVFQDGDKAPQRECGPIIVDDFKSCGDKIMKKYSLAIKNLADK